MFEGTVIARRTTSRRCTHSCAPAFFQHHLECVMRVPPQNRRGSSPNHEGNFNSATPDVQAALEGFEKVVGIRAQDISFLFQCAPSLDDARQWEERLLSWKDVNGGKDMFLRKLGSFNIPQVYEHHVIQRKMAFTSEILRTIKIDPLRKTAKKMIRGDTALSVPKTADDTRDFLSKTMNLDLPGLLEDAFLSEAFKKVRFCESKEPPFPLFVNAESYYWHGGEQFKKRIDWTKIRNCAYSGGMRISDYSGASSSPFWLLSTAELQAFGYFSDALSRHAANYPEKVKELVFLLSCDDECPQKQYLLDHYDFWNCRQNIGSIDELAEVARRNETDDTWPPEWETMQPRQLLNVLRQNERMRHFGPLETYSHLDLLPDDGQLQVLRTNHDILEAGSELKNCAASYIGDVRNKWLVLVLLRDQSGKPLALGSHPLFGSWSERGWSQIYEACNKPPSREVVAKFMRYSRIFRPWHRDVFSELRLYPNRHGASSGGKFG